MTRMAASDIERCVIDLLRRRAGSASICPSDVARALTGDEDGWRELMPAVRDVAARMAHRRHLIITQGDATLDPDEIDHGPIRLRRGPEFPHVG
jgi:hypothetical protein